MQRPEAGMSSGGSNARVVLPGGARGTWSYPLVRRHQAAPLLLGHTAWGEHCSLETRSWKARGLLMKKCFGTGTFTEILCLQAVCGQHTCHLVAGSSGVCPAVPALAIGLAPAQGQGVAVAPVRHPQQLAVADDAGELAPVVRRQLASPHTSCHGPPICSPLTCLLGPPVSIGPFQTSRPPLLAIRCHDQGTPLPPIHVSSPLDRCSTSLDQLIVVATCTTLSGASPW